MICIKRIAVLQPHSQGIEISKKDGLGFQEYKVLVFWAWFDLYPEF